MSPAHHAVAARLNPFRAERIEALRFRMAEADWDALLARLAALRWRGAIVGPQGSGKTTLLLEVAARLEAQGRRVAVQLADGETGLSRAGFAALLAAAPARGVVWCLDGADRLTPWQWRRFLAAARNAAGLVTTQHQARRLPTVHECRVSEGLFAALVDELLRGESAAARPGPGQLAALFRARQGNVREALRALYDRWAGGPAPAEGAGADLPAGLDAAI